MRAGSRWSRFGDSLTDFVAQDNSDECVRSYAHGLLRWWRLLHAIGVEWDKATPAEGRDLVLWLTHATKTRLSPRTKSTTTAGTVNPITRKRYPGDRYAACTIRHSNAGEPCCVRTATALLSLAIGNGARASAEDSTPPRTRRLAST
ncbi:hypothetical protein BJD99_08365 [Rhodococcus sp. 1163]|uniref:hypothetical protein n=1 Tax=unclassified Rhodococcus (in: high G+C Gram-positive bacteria) TaxID=192944 RepID=UPI000A044E2E|nr:hypothetical protein [Rhodococcus sp. 1163]ORI12944.1 hypothetical protein BJD99_08365 [Rhodococcus sp. 1163]